MKFLGLNSPEIFLILVIILSVLGPKRIEKGWSLFKRILRFLLSKEENISKANSSFDQQIDLKEEEVKAEEVKEEEVKAEEIIEVDSKQGAKSKKVKIKEVKK